MKVAEKIREDLVEQLGYTHGEANAADIYKGHGRDGYGWYVRPFGENEEWLGEDYIVVGVNIDAMQEEKEQNHP